MEKDQSKNVIKQMQKERDKLKDDVKTKDQCIAENHAKISELKTRLQQIEEAYRKQLTFGCDLEKEKQCLQQNLIEAKNKNDTLQNQLETIAEDSARQKFKLSEEVHRLHGENKALKSRVSELAGAKLMDNNPDIADLSDPNRATKLGERFSSLYDDDWTDTCQVLMEKKNMKEVDAIRELLRMLVKTYNFCRTVSDVQMDCLCNVFENPCQDVSKSLTQRGQKVQITQKERKDLKDLRKQIASKKIDSIKKQFIAKEAGELRKGDKKEKAYLDEMKTYYEKCIEVCWPMVLHDPPVKMDLQIEAGGMIDPNRFRLYSGKGDTLEYLVWPPLIVEGGGLLAKGVAKPKTVRGMVKKT